MGDLEIQNDGFITNSNFGDCHSHSTLAKHISVKLKYWVKILGKNHGDRVFSIESFPNCKVVKTLTFCHVAKQRSLPAAIFSCIDVPAHITRAASE